MKVFKVFEFKRLEDARDFQKDIKREFGYMPKLFIREEGFQIVKPVGLVKLRGRD